VPEIAIRADGALSPSAAGPLSGIRTNASAWSNKEAQIDVLIERADDVVSTIEIKFSDEPLVISGKFADELRRKIATFRAQTKLRQSSSRSSRPTGSPRTSTPQSWSARKSAWKPCSRREGGRGARPHAEAPQDR
jgi:hypothetical protein